MQILFVNGAGIFELASFWRFRLKRHWKVLLANPEPNVSGSRIHALGHINCRDQFTRQRMQR